MTAPNLLDLLALLRRNALRIGAFGIGFAVLGLLLTLLIPSTYRATAVILPPDDDDLSAALSPMRRNLGGLGPLGRLGGQYFTQADIALAILRSRTMAEAIVRKFDLRKVYGQKHEEFAVRALRQSTAIRLATDGTISVAVEDRDPVRAAAIANHFLDELDRYNREFRSFRGRRTRLFLERRVIQADSALRQAEVALTAYQRRRGSVVVSPDTRGAMDAAANLLAQKLAAEVELELARGYTSERSEEVRRLQARVNQLRRQVGELPATQLGGASLVRDVSVQQQVYSLLTAQLEEARIQEAMDTPTIQVLDRAHPPQVRAWPRRSWFALFGLALGLFVGVVLTPGVLFVRPRIARATN